jgi:hypothetical protein
LAFLFSSIFIQCSISFICSLSHFHKGTWLTSLHLYLFHFPKCNHCFISS